MDTLIRDGFVRPFDHYQIPNYTPESITQLFTASAPPWGRTLIYFDRLQHCHACAQLLNDAGYRCEVISLRGPLREHQLIQFERGSLPILISCESLTAELQCPQLQSLFLCPSPSRRAENQMPPMLHASRVRPCKQIVERAGTSSSVLHATRPRKRYVWSGDSWSQRPVPCGRAQNGSANRTCALNMESLQACVGYRKC